jgi:hypothetical protein
VPVIFRRLELEERFCETNLAGDAAKMHLPGLV